MKTVSDEDIVAVARHAFLTEGHAATTRSIAERVGLSQAALVQRFGSKDALFLAAVQPDALDVNVVLGSEADALEQGGLAYLAGVATRLLECVQQQVPRLLHLRQNPTVSQRAVARAHERLGVADFVGQLGKRMRWLQGRHLLADDREAGQLVDLVLTLVHGVAFMSLVSGQGPQRAYDHFRALLAGVDGTVAPKPRVAAKKGRRSAD